MKVCVSPAHLYCLQSDNKRPKRAANATREQEKTPIQNTPIQASKMGNKVSLEDELVNLRITSKQMQRSAKKCEKNEKAAIEKLKKVRPF